MIQSKSTKQLPCCDKFYKERRYLLTEKQTQYPTAQTHSPTERKRSDNQVKTNEQIANKLMDLGFSPSHNGFNAVIKLSELWQPTEKIVAYYHIVGNELNTTGASVERCIRFCIEKAMERNHDGMCEFMHNAYDPWRGKPTIAEFMAVLHLYINASDS